MCAPLGRRRSRRPLGVLFGERQRRPESRARRCRGRLPPCHTQISSIGFIRLYFPSGVMTDTIRKSPAFASVYTTTLILSPLTALPFWVRLLALGWAGPRPWSTKIGCSYRWVLCTRRRDAGCCPPGALGPGESLYYRTTAQNSRITDACARGGE